MVVGNQATHVRENTVLYGCLSPCSRGLWEVGLRELQPQVGWGTTEGSRAASHGCQERWLPHRSAPFCPADVESQDPDSTSLVESEAPRDYFLKCK